MRSGIQQSIFYDPVIERTITPDLDITTLGTPLGEILVGRANGIQVTKKFV
jgi:hypothetical protein